jgi:nucleotide-binding universal stress UspA family protein
VISGGQVKLKSQKIYGSLIIIKDAKMKILLATDGSAHSKAMVKKFADRTFAPNTKVRIITAYAMSSYMLNTAPMGALSEYYATTDENSSKSAENASESAATILRKKNPKLSVSVAAIDGSAKSVIVEEAEIFGADLIVVGSHGHGGVAGFLLGSVSQAVALHAKCSVLIVRNEKMKK